MHRLCILAAVLLFAGCLREKVKYCQNGAFCPEPLICTERETEPFCGNSVEVNECLGKPDETACTLTGDVKGVCEMGLCKPCDTNNAACIYPDWVAMSTGTGVELTGVWAAGPREVYAVGKSGTFLRWDGKTWTAKAAPDMRDMKALFGTSETNLFASAANDVFRFDGTAWSAASTAPFPIVSLWADTSEAFAAGVFATTGQYKSASWSFMSNTLGLNASLGGVFGFAANDVFAVGANGTVLHFNGSVWAQQTTNTMYTLQGVWGVGTKVFAVGRTTGTIRPTVLRYDGTWTDITSTLPAAADLPASGIVALRAVWGPSETDLFAAGESGTLLRYNGSTWTRMQVTTSVHFNAITGAGSDVFVVGEGGTVLRYRR